MTRNTAKNAPTPATLTLCLLCAVAIAAGCGKVEPVDPASVVKSSFIDARDGKEYRAVKIGELVWMAENLNFVADSSWCYINADSNCTKYGRLYKWEAAMRACPAGWRLPDDDDWNALIRAVGGQYLQEKIGNYEGNYYWMGAAIKLRSKTGWTDNEGNDADDGTDEFGFSALPGGNRINDDDPGYNHIRWHGFWWSATMHEYGGAYYRYINSISDYVYDSYSREGSTFSVRCIQN